MSSQESLVVNRLPPKSKFTCRDVCNTVVVSKSRKTFFVRLPLCLMFLVFFPLDTTCSASTLRKMMPCWASVGLGEAPFFLLQFHDVPCAAPWLGHKHKQRMSFRALMTRLVAFGSTST